MVSSVPRLTLLMLCLACVVLGLSVGNVEHAVEHGYSPLAAAIAGVMSLVSACYLVVRIARWRGAGQAAFEPPAA